MKSMIHEPYHIINGVFMGIIGMVMVYSAVFSAEKDNHPIPSYYERITGGPSPTTGLSKSFSAIIRLNFDEAARYNAHGIRIFLFFFIQFFMRLIVSVIIIHKWLPRSVVLWFDAGISVVLFIACFQDLLLFWRYM